MPGYTAQLEAIVQALNRPTTSPWVIAVTSAVLAVIGGIAGQSLMLWVSDRYRLSKLKRVLYLELAEMFLVIDGVLEFKEFPPPDLYRWQTEQLTKSLDFQGEKVITANHDLYVQLPERLVSEGIYRRLHMIIDEPNEFSINCNLALRWFAEAVEKGGLRQNELLRYLGKRRFDRIMERVAFYRKQERELLARIAMHQPSGDSQ